ncbi:acyl-CoA dehydrogenase family protein [Nocardia sp. NPDC059239]|uniref:acyl-CoA dehydrogenase family protein n=1 Tax=unclassified Nocardia TaxID=2637762 RepID=UPI0036A54529
MSEHDALRELVQDLVGDEVPENTADVTSLWRRFEEAGLLDVGVDEDHGGSGGTMADLAVIVETTGYFGSRVPIIETSIARWVLAEASSTELFTGFVTSVLVDLSEEALLKDPVAVPSVAWGHCADHVVLCPSEGRPVVISIADTAVDVDPKLDLARSPSDTVSLGHGSARVVLEHAPDPDTIRARFALLRAAAVSGAVRGTYELTRDYVRTREQFGAPLVKIPAVASGIATIRTKVLEADAALQTALPDLSGQNLEVRVSSAFAARVVAARCATECARLAHQLHGALGTTSEYPLHRFTTALWAWRDADLPEPEWARMLGERVLAAGEAGIWAEIGASAT